MRLLHGLAMAGAMLIALPVVSSPAAADPPWKHGRHYHGGGKQVFYDGPCRVERKWKGNGASREEAYCPGYAYGPAYYPYPPVAYAYPPVVYAYPVPRGPSISVTIPLD